MKTYHQPSGLTKGLDFLIDSDWTPEQALAVVELLQDLQDRIFEHYQLPIVIFRRRLHHFIGVDRLWVHLNKRHQSPIEFFSTSQLAWL